MRGSGRAESTTEIWGGGLRGGNKALRGTGQIINNATFHPAASLLSTRPALYSLARLHR